MFAQNTTSLTARRKTAMDNILMNATKEVAQKVQQGLITRDDAEKVHVYAIASLVAGIPGAPTEAGAAEARRETVRQYLNDLIEGEETDAA